MKDVKPITDEERLIIKTRRNLGDSVRSIAYDLRVPAHWVRRIVEGTEKPSMPLDRETILRLRSIHQAARQQARKIKIESPPEADPTMAELLSLDRIRVSKEVK